MGLIERWKSEDSDMGTAFKITGPVRLDQLDAEISDAHGWKNAALVVEGNIETAGPDSPVLMHVAHAGVDVAKVVAVGGDHDPDPDFMRVAPPTTVTLLDVATKASRGGWLNEEEMQVAIRGLLARQGGL